MPLLTHFAEIVFFDLTKFYRSNYKKTTFLFPPFPQLRNIATPEHGPVITGKKIKAALTSFLILINCDIFRPCFIT